MKKQSKKTLALLLATLLVVGLFPIAGFAAEGDEPATPSSVEAPQATPTPTPESPVTPGPTETPLPTPATNSSIDVSGLSGEELAAYLRLLDEVTRTEVIKLLTTEQLESLWDFISKKERSVWFPVQKPVTDEEPGLPAVDFTDAGPLMPTASVFKQSKSARMLPQVQTVAQTENGLFLDKSVSLNPDGTYKIRMEAYTTGAVSTATRPADIVLVLDQSGSMDSSMSSYTAVTGGSYIYRGTTYYGFSDYDSDYYIKNTDGSYSKVNWEDDDNNNFDYYEYNANGSWQNVYPVLNGDYGTRQYGYPVVQFYTRTTQTRLSALKDAVTTFVENVKDDAVAHSIDHRIAIVGFAEGGSSYNNTEILSVTSGSPVKYGTGSYNNAVGNALLPANSSGSVNSALTTAITRLDGDGETRSDLGMQMAVDIFGHPSYNGNYTLPSGQNVARAKVVVLFTDGVPTDGGSQFDSGVANNAISKAKGLKDGNVTIYAIGIFDGANPGTISDNPNKYMNYVSSNYLLAQSLSGAYTRNATGNYYLSAADSGGLSAVFENISEQVSTPSIPLTSSALIKDFVTPYFSIPSGSSVTFKTAAYNGSSFGAEAPFTGPSATISGNSVSITGFDFDANCCTNISRNGFYGRKLIIEFNVSRAASFIGGNNVPTNIPETSGVYQNASLTSPLETFGSLPPVVNVPIRFSTASLQNKNIYAGDDVVLTSLFGGNYTTSSGGSTYTLGNVVTNQYSDVAYTIKDGATTIGTYTVPAGSVLGSGSCTWTGTNTVADLMADKTYTVTAAITPSEAATNAIGTAGSIANLNIGSASVNVYKPAITPKDLSVYLTQNPTTAQLNTAAIANVAWKHGADTANTATMGAAPGLTYTFSGLPASPAYPTADTGVTIASVTRTDGDLDVLTSASTITKTTAAPVGSHLKLFVLKPTLTCTDTSMFLGETTNLTGRYSGITWTGTTGAPAVAAPFATAPTVTVSPVKVTGTAPGSDLTVYKPAVTSTFKVKAAIGGVDITTLCKIMNNSTDVTSAAQHFTVTVVSGQVTIRKTGGAEGESYIFTLTSDTGITVKEVIQGNGSKVIKGLPKGTYTVTEETAWSWRYDATPTIGWTGNDRTLGQTMTDTAISCSVANTNRVPFWLSGESFAVNRFNPYTPAV